MVQLKLNFNSTKVISAIPAYYVWPLFCEEKSVWPQNFWANCDLSTLEKKNLLTKSRCFMI